MRGFGKRLSILALCLLLAGGLSVCASAEAVRDCPGSCTHQAAVDTIHYDTLAEAIRAADSGSNVTLLTDITLDAPIVAEQSVLLDLGGNTLTGNLVFTGGGTLSNGKLVSAEGIAVQVRSCTVAIDKTAQVEGCGTAPALSVTADQDLTAKVNVAGTITGKDTAPVIQVTDSQGSCEVSILKNAQVNAEENPAIAFDSGGKLEVSDGTIRGEKDLLCLHFAKDRKTEVAVTGGKLLSEEGEAIVITAGEEAEIPADFVTGGTYQKVPKAYVPDYCVIRENADGTYTVISSYTLTFLPGGASGTMDAITVQCGSACKLPKCSFTPADNMDFAGWQIGGKTYAAGDSYTPTDDVTVTALWKAHVHSGGKATCLKKAVCSTCGQTYGKLGAHNLSYTGGYAPTCDTVGMNAHHKCSVCGGCFVSGISVSASSLTIPALGHSWETVEGKPATCTEEGLKAHRKCGECGTFQVDGIPVTEEELVIPAAGHTLEDVEASQATCSEPGIRAHEHCTVCGGQFVEGAPVEIAQLTTATSSHVLSDWRSDEHYHWKTCVDCEEVFRQRHHADTDGDGLCDDCGYALPDTPVQELPQEEPNFFWLFLLPLFIAVVIAVYLALRKRKEVN